MTKADLMKIPVKEFGLPRERKFPMQDEKHLRAAIAYFYTAKPDKQKELAKNIVRRREELKSNVKISKKNPLFKFVPDEMKNLNESSSLFENVNPEHFGQMFGPKGKEIVESLMTKTGLGSVDEVDCHVPDEYRKKGLLLGTLKSYILNEMGDDYPVVYMDYHLTKEDLKGNNGGLRTLSETSVLLDYRSVLNESSNLDVVKDIGHIQFCALLREWDESYSSGHRNPTYDRLMIESWKTRVYDLLTEAHDEGVDTAGSVKIKAIHHADIETKQKLVDLGIKDPDEYQKNHIIGDDINAKSPIHKSAEIGFDITKDIIDKHHNGENTGAVDNALDLKLYTYKDDVYIHQKDKHITFDEFWRMD